MKNMHSCLDEKKLKDEDSKKDWFSLCVFGSLETLTQRWIRWSTWSPIEIEETFLIFCEWGHVHCLSYFFEQGPWKHHLPWLWPDGFKKSSTQHQEEVLLWLMNVYDAQKIPPTHPAILRMFEDLGYYSEHNEVFMNWWGNLIKQWKTPFHENWLKVFKNEKIHFWLTQKEQEELSKGLSIPFHENDLNKEIKRL